MNEIEYIKQRMKAKRHTIIETENDTKQTDNNSNKYINNLITRILLSVILFFGIIIFTNSSSKNKEIFKDKILKDNMSFTKISNLYNKYFGSVLPLDNIGNDASTVFNEKIVYQSIDTYKDGYELSVTDNYLIPIIESGIVVFSGEKEGYGNTIIIQGIDEIDYWYSNVHNTSVSLYDYVTKGTLLGTSKGTKLYLTFQKNGDYLGYDEVIE